MVFINMLLTIMIIVGHGAVLVLLFYAIMQLDIKLRNNKHREAVLTIALCIYILIMAILSMVVKEGFNILWG